MGRTSVATDNFNRADSNITANANWAYIRLSTWDAVPPQIKTNVVVGKVLDASVGGNHQACRWVGTGSFTADQYASIVVGSIAFNGSSFAVGPAVRVQSGTDAAASYYGVWVLDDASGGGSHTIVLFKNVSGTQTQLDSRTQTYSNGDTLELEAVGTSLKVYRNATLLYTVTDTSISAAGAPGIVISGNNTAVLSLDTWDGGNVASGTTVAPGVGNIAMTGYAPTVAQSNNQTVAPGVGSLTITGFAPTISQAAPGPQSVAPGVGNIAISGFAPTVTRTSLGNITTDPLKNNTAAAQASLTGLTVVVCSATGVPVVTKTNQTTNSSGVMLLTDALIVSGVTYTLLFVDPAGTAVGCARLTAA